MSLVQNVEFLRRMSNLHELNGFGGFARSLTPKAGSPLVEITGFGANPGDLRMLAFVPAKLQPKPGLVVVLPTMDASPVATSPRAKTPNDCTSSGTPILARSLMCAVRLIVAAGWPGVKLPNGS